MATTYLIKQAEKGDRLSQYQLGLEYAQGNHMEEALNWWSKAADQGELNAQIQLGIMYAQGKGVYQDYEEAAKWYRKAADQGNAESQNLLGVLYALGKGVPHDNMKAYFWLSLAAANKSDSASVRDAIGSDLTHEQREEVEARCSKWMEELARKK